jgi:hypothetical protein
LIVCTYKVQINRTRGREPGPCLKYLLVQKRFLELAYGYVRGAVSKCLFTNFTNLINVINELILIRERFLVVQGIPEFLGIGITAVVDLDRFDLAVDLAFLLVVMMKLRLTAVTLKVFLLE